MRLAAFIVALLSLSGSAYAQSWKEYSYPDLAFTVSFPAEPKTETTTYMIADGEAAPAAVYSVSQETGAFKMMVVDLSKAGLDDSAVIDSAVKALAKNGEIKVNIPARVGRVFGRQLSIAGADGSRSTVALFYYEGRLYQIDGTSLPPGNATSDAIRFQQSLIFTDHGTNAGPNDHGPGDGRRRGERRDRAGGPRDRGAPAPVDSEKL
jgi:hypothetical protein